MKAPGLFTLQFNPRLATRARINPEKSLTIFPSGASSMKKTTDSGFTAKIATLLIAFILAKFLGE